MAARSNDTLANRGRTANQSNASAFDHLPDSAHVRVQTVAELFATTPSTVWRWVKANRVPAPVKLGPQTTAWRVGDLREALNAKANVA